MSNHQIFYEYSPNECDNSIFMNIHQILVIGGAVADWSKALLSGEKINENK